MTVALVDRDWVGHHPTYFKAFSEVLMELGHDVLAICPAPGELLGVEQSARLRHRDGTRLEGMMFAPPRPPLRPRRYRRAAHIYLENRWLRRKMLDWESSSGRKISLVFFACIYGESFRYFPKTRKGFPWQWSGLYLHCRGFRETGEVSATSSLFPRQEELFSHPALHSVAILDEAAVEYMRDIARERPIYVFPDFTDNSVPVVSDIANNLRLLASGRPIVGLLGGIHWRKGFGTLARVALDLENRDIVFAFVGELMPGGLDPEEQQLLDRLKTTANVLVHCERVPTEAAFNSIIQTCDILFAAYHDFPHSSNIITKAANFNKPVIVSDGYLMAERVRRYGLGEVVAQRSVIDSNVALRRILSDRAEWMERHQPQWATYCALHSLDSLKRAFGELLSAHKSTPGVS